MAGRITANSSRAADFGLNPISGKILALLLSGRIRRDRLDK
jgi:hypothetical protein